MSIYSFYSYKFIESFQSNCKKDKQLNIIDYEYYQHQFLNFLNIFRNIFEKNNFENKPQKFWRACYEFKHLSKCTKTISLIRSIRTKNLQKFPLPWSAKTAPLATCDYHCTSRLMRRTTFQPHSTLNCGAASLCFCDKVISRTSISNISLDWCMEALTKRERPESNPPKTAPFQGRTHLAGRGSKAARHGCVTVLEGRALN